MDEKASNLFTPETKIPQSKVHVNYIRISKKEAPDPVFKTHSKIIKAFNSTQRQSPSKVGFKPNEPSR